MIAGADVIYTMTSHHADAVRAMDPSAAPRVQTLDPQGDVPDPIGMPQDVYDQTAHRLGELIARRLQELEA